VAAVFVLRSMLPVLLVKPDRERLTCILDYCTCKNDTRVDCQSSPEHHILLNAFVNPTAGIVLDLLATSGS
jgi:hypothetical protein